MRRQPAKVLEPGDVRRLIDHVSGHRHPLRNEVMILLSFNAGLRACEMAGLDWQMVLTSDDRIGDQLNLGRGITKGGRPRQIPLNTQLRSALRRLHRYDGKPLAGPVIRSERRAHMTPRSIVNWFASTYAEIGLIGCSSHSGRRTFITRSARLITKIGGSLRDVQELAGHRALTTTERYIEGDRAAQRRLVALL